MTNECYSFHFFTRFLKLDTKSRKRVSKSLAQMNLCGRHAEVLC